MRREQGVLPGICRKYQDRDDIKDGNKCLRALDNLIAEVSAKLEEYNIDVTPTVSHTQTLISAASTARTQEP